MKGLILLGSICQWVLGKISQMLSHPACMVNFQWTKSPTCGIYCTRIAQGNTLAIAEQNAAVAATGYFASMAELHHLGEAINSLSKSIINCCPLELSRGHTHDSCKLEQTFFGIYLCNLSLYHSLKGSCLFSSIMSKQLIYIKYVNFSQLQQFLCKYEVPVQATTVAKVHQPFVLSRSPSD